MKKEIIKKESGVTLTTLIITVILLILMTSVATYSGIQVVRNSREQRFTTEMEILYTSISKIASERKEFNENEGEILEKNSEHYRDLLDRIDLVTEYGYSSEEESVQNYRFFTPQELEEDLQIEGIDQSVFINLAEKKIISLDGVKYEGKTVYVIEQVSSDIYIVDYKGMDTSKKPTFKANISKEGDNKWNVEITDIQFSENINKWQVQYKLEDGENWNTSSNLSFLVTEQGKYIVKIVNGDIESEENIINIEE